MNPKIRALIIDDEQDAIENLKYALEQQYFELVEFCTASNSTLNALEIIQKNQINTLFLDIEMPTENGFQFLERLNKPDIKIIFVTAYDQYAIKALRLNAFDYLLKPLDHQELYNCICKLENNLNFSEHTAVALENLEQSIKQKSFNNIIIKGHQQTDVIPLKQILFVESCNGYAKFVYEEMGSIKNSFSYHTLTYYEELLDKHTFIRVHKSYIVNVNNIYKIHATKLILEMIHNFEIPVSRRRMNPFIEFMKTFKH